MANIEKSSLNNNREVYTNAIRWGNTIYYRGIRDGKRVNEKVKYAPTLFLPSNKTNSKYRTLDGRSVEPVKFSSMSEAKEFIEQYKGMDNFNVYGNTRYLYTFLADRFPDDIDVDMKNVLISYLDIEVASENGYATVDNPTEEITAITVLTNGTFVTFACGEYISDEPKINKYIQCKSEVGILSSFLEYWQHTAPDIISGWNINFFDIPYLFNRISRVLGEEAAKRLSPWKIVNSKKVKYNAREITSYELIGISTLDYMELYNKFMPKQESMKLNYIAHVELNEQKISYQGSLDELRENDFQKFIDYNIKDVELISKLEEKLQLISVAVHKAYYSKTNFYDVFAPTRLWDAIIFSHFKKKNLVFPPDKDNTKLEKYAGAYVKDVVPGMYDWLVSFDLNSLYPNLIAQFNISPETLRPEAYRSGTFSYDQSTDSYDVSKIIDKKIDLKYLKDSNLTMAANGHCFTTEKMGFLPEILMMLYEERKLNKKKMIESEKSLELVYEKLKTDPTNQSLKDEAYKFKYEISKYNNFQTTQKLLLNSCYGALGTPYFRFYDVRMAEAITLSGQTVIQKIANDVNVYLNKLLKSTNRDYVIAIDTDSIYLGLNSVVDVIFSNNSPEDKLVIVDALDKFSEQKLQPIIDNSCKDLKEYLNGFMNKMVMKRESIADRAIFTAKKRYMMNVYDSEGVRYYEPKLKIKGLEAIKSSTPEICRKRIKEAMKILINKTEKDLQKFISDFREEFRTLNPEDVAFPRGCNGLEEYANVLTVSGPGTPIHVRGALRFNHMLREKKLRQKYQEIRSGDKVKFLYLKKPNLAHDHVISFPEILPEEFNLHKSIDYDIQFDKTFLDPLTLITRAIGWQTEHKTNILDLF